MTDLTKAAREALEALEAAEALLFSMGMQSSDAYQETDQALATLRAALDEAPGEEREAFEAWWAGLCPAPYYPGIEKEIARNAWQARAMLAARPEAPTVALTEEQLMLMFLTVCAENPRAIGLELFKAGARAVERLHGIGKEGGA